MTSARGPVDADTLFRGWVEIWPLSCEAGFFRAPMSDVDRRLSKSGIGDSRVEFDSLRSAVANIPQQFDMGSRWAWYLASSTNSEWTLILSSRCPYPELGEFMVARADHDVRCDYVGIGWLAQSPETVGELRSAPAGAQFIDFRRSSRLLRKQDGRDTRFIQVSEQDSGWEFSASGPVRPYEDLERYSARRKADRLTRSTIGSYLRAAGVPVDDEWLDQPTTVLLEAGGGSAPDAYSDIAQLRQNFGYPPSGVPQTLTR